MANPGSNWYPPGSLCYGLPKPVVPLHEMERITGRLHLSTYCRMEAKKEFDAFLHHEEYRFIVPETDEEGYLLR